MYKTTICRKSKKGDKEMENKGQGQPTVEELQVEVDMKLEMSKLDNMFTDMARELADEAEWYDSEHCPSLAELCRYSQRSVHHFIDLFRSECKTLDDVDELLDSFRYDAWNYYKLMQSEHFEHLAELAMARYLTFGELVTAVERNK